MCHFTPFLRVALTVLLLSVLLVQAQPGGELCITATVIPTVPFNGNGQMGNADNCPGQPLRDVFYSYTATVAGNYNAGLCGSPDNTILKIWTAGTCCAGAALVSDNVCGDDPQINFPMAVSQTVIFELGYVSAASPPQTYSFTLTGPPPCSGTLQLPISDLVFPPTTVGSSVQLPFQIMNTSGSSNLCVTDVHSNGSIWQVSPTNFQLLPNQVQPLMITFAPSFEHEFLGTIEIVSSDPVNSIDSITVQGTGYRPQVSPIDPLSVWDSGTWNSLYFSLPFEDGVVFSLSSDVHALKIAIQYSSDNFATSEYVKYPEGISDVPDWATGSQWGIGSENVILGLESDTDYQIRYRIQDPLGAEQVSLPTNYHTPREPVIKNPDLTIKAEGNGSVSLNWDPVLKDTSHIRITNYGFWVYESSHLDSPYVPIEFVFLGLQSISAPLSDKKFYYVEPLQQGAWYGARPIISWPPNGSTCAGELDIALKDFAHYAEWDSFTVEDDYLGDQYLLGSNLNNTTSLMGQYGARANLSNIGLGPHLITATVVDHEGTSHATSISVNVVAEPFATFSSTYDSGTRRFSLTETSTIIPAGYTQAGTLWLWSHVGERYGSNINVNWSPDYDSLMLVKVIPPLNEKIVCEVMYDQQKPYEIAGVTPQSTHPDQPYTLIRCCCVDLVLSSSGSAKGKYSGYNGRLGAIADCDGRSGNFQVGFGFEVDRNIIWELSPTFNDCSMGQDAKGTRDFSQGSCKNQTNTCTIAVTDTIKKSHGGQKFGFTESNSDGFGNDGYGARNGGPTTGRNRGTRDESGKVGKDKVKKAGKAAGTLRYYDVPSDFGTVEKGHCIRDKAKNMFFSKIEPPCGATPCCLMFKIEWDVTMCKRQNECIVTQTQAPTLTPVIPPDGGCPALAP